jgi:hypothetical protein
MSHQEIVKRLDEYVDGALSAAEARRVEDHVEGCADCREALARLGRLLDAATALRERTVMPKQDLWPGILRRVEEERAGVRPEAAPSPPRRRPFVLSALLGSLARAFAHRPLVWSAGAIVVMAALFMFVIQGRGPMPASPALITVAGLTTLESETARARGDFESALRQRGGDLPGGAGSEFERNLQILDQAIADSRAAVERDPRNQGLVKSLLAVYQKQLTLLRWATRMVQQA